MDLLIHYVNHNCADPIGDPTFLKQLMAELPAHTWVADSKDYKLLFRATSSQQADALKNVSEAEVPRFTAYTEVRI